ncbi:MAG: hypothetical protein Q8R83_01625 [Legionellaceae bacterium]|nr:hypothetical protein [Legionellaceae bacterium]
MRVFIMQMFLSKTETVLDFEYQTKAMALCLRTQKNFDGFEVLSSQIKENIKLEKSELPHKIQSLVFLSKVHQIPFSRELREKLFNRLGGSYIYCKEGNVGAAIGPLLSEKFSKQFFNNFRLEYQHQVYALSILPAERVRVSLDYFISYLLNGNSEWVTSEVPNFVRAKVACFKKIIHQLTKDQIKNVLRQMDDQQLIVQTMLWDVLLPYLSKDQVTVIFQKILTHLNDDSRESILALKIILNKLTYPQLEEVLLRVLELKNSYTAGIALIAPLLSFKKIQTIIQEMQNHINSTPSKSERIKISQILFILLNSLAEKTEDKKNITELMMFFLSRASADFYNDAIREVISNLASDLVDEALNLLLDKFREKPSSYPIRLLLSQMAHRFNEGQLSRLRAHILPQLSNQGENKLPYQVFYYKLTQGIKTEEIDTVLLSMKDENGAYDLNGLKLIAQIAPLRTNKVDIDEVYNLFLNIIKDEIAIHDVRTYHFFICKLIQFIPMLSHDQAIEIASELSKKKKFGIYSDVENAFSPEKPSETMPFEQIDNSSHVINTQGLVQHALTLLLSNVDHKDRSIILKDAIASGSESKGEFVCNELSKRLFKGESIDLNMSDEELSLASVGASLLNIITDAWTKLSPKIEESISSKTTTARLY